jgi:hypothetical protein
VTPLQRLEQAGELRLVRSAWCVPEVGQPGEWRQMLSVEQGMALARTGQAVLDGTTLRPRQGGWGGSDG